MKNTKIPKIDWDLLEISIKKRKSNIDTTNIKKLEEKYKNQIKIINKIREELNKFNNINKIKAANKEEVDKTDKHTKELINAEKILEEIYLELNDSYRKLPNYLDDSVVEGSSEEEDKIIKTNGELFFNINHYDLKEVITNTVEMAGSRFIGLKGELATLYRCLYNFYSTELLKNQSTEYILPVLLLKDSFYRSRHLPLEEDNMFSTKDGRYYLVPTGEVSLVNLAFNRRDFTKPEFVFFTSPCFRKEAGATGKDTKGLIRLHQFYKTEHVCFTPKEYAKESLDKMINISYGILEKLGLDRRIVQVCSGEMGKNSIIQYDLQIPIGGKWRECASISDTGILQSFYLNAKTSKIKNSIESDKYIHILNGSTLPVERILAGLIEKYYDKKTNSIIIPDVLIQFFGKERIFF